MNPNIGMKVHCDQFQVKEILLQAVPPSLQYTSNGFNFQLSNHSREMLLSSLHKCPNSI